MARLIDLAGPAQGRAIIDRLILDLTLVRQSLTAALALRDLVELRRHLHVLIGIAGTVGAGPLHVTARCISDELRLGHPERVRDLDALLDVLITRLAAIRSFLGAG